MYVCSDYKKSKKSMQPLPLAPGSVHYTGSPVQVYRSENHFGPSELRELMRVLATHTQSVNGGLRYTYSDQNIVQLCPSSNSNDLSSSYASTKSIYTQKKTNFLKTL